MPITYSIDPGARLVQTKATGRVTLEDVLSHSHLLKSDPHFNPHYCNLIDLTGFTGTDLNQDAMKAFAQGFQGEVFAPDARRAVVAPSAAAFELSTRFQALRSDNENFQVFHTLDEAMHWLHADHNKSMLFE